MSSLARPFAKAAGVVAVVALIAWSSGCRDIERIEIPNIFRQMPERPLADVPVPVGFSFQERGSYVFNNNYRVAKLRYVGAPRVGEVESFYKEQMPLSCWEMVSAGGERKRVLEFQSSGETCKITVNRKSGVSSIDIEVSPRSV